MLLSILHTITSALLVPVVVILMALGVVIVLMVGMLIAEFFTERRYFKLSIPQLVDDLQHTDDIAGVVSECNMLKRQKNALLEILNHPDATPTERESMAVNIVAQEEAIYDNRVKVSDLISKIAPMMGLMGTLIPLGPGIIAIGTGDTGLLSDSLLVAFDTTITGLVIASLSLLISTIRKSWYVKYSAAFEAACEIVLEKANEEAPTEEQAPLEDLDSTEKMIPVDVVAPTGEMAPVDVAAPTEEMAPVDVAAPTEEMAPVDMEAPLQEGDHA